MKQLLLSLLLITVVLQTGAQMPCFPEHLTGLKGFRRCIERSASHLKGGTDTVQRLSAIHYLDANGNDTAIQRYWDDTTLAERIVISYSDGRITAYRKYGGNDYSDTSDRFNPALLQSTTTCEYKSGQPAHILTVTTNGAVSDRYFIYDSLARIRKEVEVSHADMVTYSYKVKGKKVTVDRDTIIRQYDYAGPDVVERISGSGRQSVSYTYTYDNKGSLLRQVFRQGSGRITQTTEHSYDMQGRLTETTYHDVTSGAGRMYVPYTRSVNSYDQEGRLAEQVNYSRLGITRQTYKYER